jgi:hypothetical protein
MQSLIRKIRLMRNGPDRSIEELETILRGIGVESPLEDVLPPSYAYANGGIMRGYSRTGELVSQRVEGFRVSFPVTKGKHDLVKPGKNNKRPAELVISGTYVYNFRAGNKVEGIWQPTPDRKTRFEYRRAI